LLHRTGAPDHLVAAGLLHDIIEKTEADAAELTLRFGSSIAALVLAVSEDEQMARYADRKAALRTQVAAAGREALMLFAADKISKVRELSLEHACTRQSSRARRLRLAHYHDCLRLLEEHLADSRLVRQLRTELARASRQGC
jgi:(p)ppGpp synthase/HD superfamily hydrolase